MNGDSRPPDSNLHALVVVLSSHLRYYCCFDKSSPSAGSVLSTVDMLHRKWLPQPTRLHFLHRRWPHGWASVSVSYFNMFTSFQFYSMNEPIRTYVDSGTAAADNLTFATDDVFIMRADDTTVLTADDPGRKSVRITSVATFGSPSAIVYISPPFFTWKLCWFDSDSTSPTCLRDAGTVLSIFCWTWFWPDLPSTWPVWLLWKAPSGFQANLNILLGFLDLWP